jgi:hypothetical protein
MMEGLLRLRPRERQTSRKAGTQSPGPDDCPFQWRSHGSQAIEGMLAVAADRVCDLDQKMLPCQREVDCAKLVVTIRPLSDVNQAARLGGSPPEVRYREQLFN